VKTNVIKVLFLSKHAATDGRTHLSGATWNGQLHKWDTKNYITGWQKVTYKWYEDIINIKKIAALPGIA